MALAGAMNMFARQAAPTTAFTSQAALTSYDDFLDCTYNTAAYSQFDNCVASLDDSFIYPTCYNWYTDNGCCQSYLTWEYSFYSCANLAYSTCFNYNSYVSSVASDYPCYSGSPFTATAPNSAPAQTTRSVPSLVLESISYGPPTTTPSHSPIPSYTGSGDLLQGYCNTPDYILLDGPTALWAPIIGCNTDKSDCCPYAVAQETNTAAATGTTVTVISTITVNVGPGGPTATAYTGLNAYPIAVSANQATLQRCPNDYQTVSGACCPSGYQLWNAVLGGQVPCYSSLNNFLSAPAVPVSNYQTPISIPLTDVANQTSSYSTPSYGSGKPTSAVVNVVYAVQYPLAPSQGLSTGAKAGIGAGAGVCGIAIIFLVFALIWRTRKHNKDKKAFAAAQANGEGSTAGLGAATGQTPNIITPTSPGQSLQTPGSYMPQNGYFPPPQMQQTQPGYPSQNFYGEQTAPYGQVQYGPPAQYPSPPPSSISPPPPSEGGYSNQGGYPPPVSASAYAPSSTGSAAPPSYGYPPNYLTSSPAEIARRPVGASATPTTVSPQTTGQGYGYPGHAEMGVPGQQVQQHEQIQQGQRQELHDQSQPMEMGS